MNPQIPNNFPITAATLRQLGSREKVIRALSQARMIPTQYQHFQNFTGRTITRIQELLNMSLAPSYAENALLFNAGILKIAPARYVYDRSKFQEDFDLLRPMWAHSVAFVINDEVDEIDNRVQVGTSIYLYQVSPDYRVGSDYTTGFVPLLKEMREKLADELHYMVDGSRETNYKADYTRLECFHGQWLPVLEANRNPNRTRRYDRDVEGRVLRRREGFTQWNLIWNRDQHVATYSVSAGWKHNLPRHTLVDHSGRQYAELLETQSLEHLAEGEVVRRARDIQGLGLSIQTARRTKDGVFERLDGPGIVLEIRTDGDAYNFTVLAAVDEKQLQNVLRAFRQGCVSRGDNRRYMLNGAVFY